MMQMQLISAAIPRPLNRGTALGKKKGREKVKEGGGEKGEEGGGGDEKDDDRRE